MALCSSCQSVLPNSAPACPVCGGTSIGESGLSADEFISQMDGRPPAAAPTPAAPSSSQTPPASQTPPPPLPAAPTAGPLAPERPHDGALWGPPVRAGEFGEPADPPAIAPRPRTGHFGDEPLSPQVVNEVVAISHRLKADVRVGRSRTHQAIVVGVPLLAALVGLGFGILVYATEPTYTPVDETSLPVDGVLAFEDVAGGLTSEGSNTSTTNPGLVTVTSPGCGEPITMVGLLLTETRVLVLSADVVTAAAPPSIVLSDGTTIPAEVVGVDPNEGIAVLQLSAPAPGATVGWGNADLLLSGPTVVVANLTDSGVVAEQARVDDVRGVNGVIEYLELTSLSGSTDTTGDASTATPVGAAVFNDAGLLVGFTDRTGVRSSSVLRSAFSRLVLESVPPTVACPVVEEPTEE